MRPSQARGASTIQHSNRSGAIISRVGVVAPRFPENILRVGQKQAVRSLKWRETSSDGACLPSLAILKTDKLGPVPLLAPHRQKHKIWTSNGHTPWPWEGWHSHETTGPKSNLGTLPPRASSMWHVSFSGNCFEEDANSLGGSADNNGSLHSPSSPPKRQGQPKSHKNEVQHDSSLLQCMGGGDDAF